MEQLYTRVFYEFRPFSEEVTALRLGAPEAVDWIMCVWITRVPTPYTEEGVGLYRVRQTPPAISYAGFKVH